VEDATANFNGAQSRAKASVVLVSMPWHPPAEPSLGLGILKSCLTRAGVTSWVHHASSALLGYLTLDTHIFLARCLGINEFLFTANLDPVVDDDQLKELVHQVTANLVAGGPQHPRYRSVPEICDLILTLREEVIPAFLKRTAEQVLARKPDLVGLTCMFDQTIASAALARTLKDMDSGLSVVLGGYALEGPPGNTVAAALPFIDWVVQGDGEEAIVMLAEATIDRTPQAKRPPRGIIRSPKVNLTMSPIPDYDDWFAGLETLRSEHKVQVKTSSLLVESSRGCWWGATKHCVFCGIDEETLRYRQKPPEQVIGMLRELRGRYGKEIVLRFSDYIFPKANYETLLPALAKESPKFKLWGEIKANQPVERVEAFAEAGFTGMQPGIESFSSAVLKSMDKGVRAIDNVALLVHGYENRVIIEYNFLYGLPDDQPEDYRAMIAKIPLLYHLTPPVSRTETIITRFAPLQASPERFLIPARPRHYRSYDLIFSQRFLKSAGLDMDNYCYYFERNFRFKPGLQPLYRLAVDIINCWKQQHRERKVWLSYRVDSEHVVHISDARYGQEDRYTLSHEAGALLLAALARPLNITRYAEKNVDGPAALEELRKRRLVWEEKDLVVALATSHTAAEERMSSGWVRKWEGIYT